MRHRPVTQPSRRWIAREAAPMPIPTGSIITPERINKGSAVGGIRGPMVRRLKTWDLYAQNKSNEEARSAERHSEK